MRSLAAAVAVVSALIAPGFARAAPAGWPDKLTMGFIPTESASHVTERWDGLLAYLSKRLGIPVEAKTATDYNGVITAMQFKHVDVAYFGPKSYVEAAARANAEAFALEVAEDGSHGYHSTIIVKRGSGLKSVADLKGKTWAFTDPNSTSGMLVPTVYFVKELRIAPEQYFSKVSFSGSHEASILAVKAGRVDAAAAADMEFARGEGKLWTRDEFDVIWTSKLLPGSPMAWRKDLPDSLKQAIREAFLAYAEPEGLKKLKLRGFVAADDAVYNPIRDQIEVKKQLAKQ
jgi:phosphonate transport system substrate-binding protein